MKRLCSFLEEWADFIWQFIATAILSNHSVMASSLRRRLYRTVCMIDPNVFITNKNNFAAEKGSCLYEFCYILNNHGNFSIGRNSHLGAFCYVNVCYGNVMIGEDVAVGPGTKIIAYSNYYHPEKKVTEVKITGDILIKNNVFLGANCTILPGTIINENVIVGAGSLVEGELEANAIYVGIPCKKVKSDWYGSF